MLHKTWTEMRKNSMSSSGKIGDITSEENIKLTQK